MMDDKMDKKECYCRDYPNAFCIPCFNKLKDKIKQQAKEEFIKKIDEMPTDGYNNIDRVELKRRINKNE